MTAGVMRYPPRLNQLGERGSARPSISSPRKQFAFSVMSGVNPEEPLWQRPERRFRPFGRIFHEKCGPSGSERRDRACAWRLFPFM